MSVRMRVIMEIEYAGATDEEDEEIRSHLAAFVHAAAASGMLTNDTLDAQDVKVTDVAAACERLLDAAPEPEPELPSEADVCGDCHAALGGPHAEDCDPRWSVGRTAVTKDDCGTRVKGGHLCEERPGENCEYDDDRDPCHDDCVYCHDPEERK